MTTARRALPLLSTLGALLCCGAAPAAPAAWTGTLALEILGAGAPPAAITGSGVAEVEAEGAALVSLALGGGIAGAVTLPLSDPGAAGSLYSVAVAASLGSGSLGPFWPPAPLWQPQLTRNVLPVPGMARLCVLAPGCAVGPVLPLTAGSGATGVGVGGLLTVGGAATLRFSVAGAPWTTATATLGVATSQGASFTAARAGFVHGPGSFASGSTALPGASLQLVTPVVIAVHAADDLPAFGVLTLRFVPEPGSLLLIAPGVVGLLALARARRP